MTLTDYGIKIKKKIIMAQLNPRISIFIPLNLAVDFI
jgi:hypothetical protein